MSTPDPADLPRLDVTSIQVPTSTLDLDASGGEGLVGVDTKSCGGLFELVAEDLRIGQP